MAFAGANAEIFAVMEKTVVDINGKRHHLGPTGERIYLNTTSTQPGPVPASWPKIADTAARACVSIRPEPVSVVRGHLDDALVTFLKSAPRHGPPSLLGLWHEASTMGYPIHPANLRGAQSHIQALAKKHHANVKVGAIENATISADKSRIWMAKNLDFYCCDIYDDRGCTTVPSAQLDQFHRYCNALMDSRSATIGVTETNSRCPKRRPYWFTHVWSWLQSHGFGSDSSSCFLTYWNPSGPESGPWRPDDRATIDALYGIFEKSSP
jgi:hypothetical protein